MWPHQRNAAYHSFGDPVEVEVNDAAWPQEIPDQELQLGTRSRTPGSAMTVNAQPDPGDIGSPCKSYFGDKIIKKIIERKGERE